MGNVEKKRAVVAKALKAGLVSCIKQVDCPACGGECMETDVINEGWFRCRECGHEFYVEPDEGEESDE